jgi:hypothetical protein
MEPNSLLKSYAFSASVWILTIINTTVFLVSRNSFWISHPGQAWLAAGRTEDRTYLASEFERNLSCYAPLTCLRSGSAFLSQALIELTTFISEATRINLTIDQKTFIILIGGLAWRLLCLGIFVFAIKKLFRNFKAGILLGNALIFLLSGLPLWQLGRLLVNLPLDLSPSIIERANEAFVHMSFSDLIFYDYGFFALIPLTALALSKDRSMRRVSNWRLFLVGFSVAGFYEAFIPIIILATVVFVWIDERRLFLKAFTLFLGQIIWTLVRAFSIKFTEPSDPNSTYFFDTSLVNILKSFRTTVQSASPPIDSLPSISVQLLLIAGLALTSGTIFAFYISAIYKSLKISKRQMISIEATTLATTSAVLLSFLRPTSVETGRQSLGLSIALIIFAFAQTHRLLQRKR